MARPAVGKVSLKQIAEAAGVSTMTVSFALRNSPQVSEETRQRIGRLARKLGYRPDPEISRYMAYLRRDRSSGVFRSTIGFLNFQDNPDGFHGGGFYTRFLEGVRVRAEDMGFALEEVWAGNPAISAKRLKTILQARGIDSIIIPPLPRDAVHLELDCSGFYGVTIAFTLESPRLARISHDHVEGIRLAMKNVARLGYKRPGFISTTYSNARVRQHWSGGFLGCSELLPKADRVPSLLLDTLDCPALTAWLTKHQPDVILTPHVELFGLLLKRGLRVPHDLGYVLLDWSSGDPSWAGIDQHVSHLGHAAVDVLIAQRNRNEAGAPPHARTILIEGSWRDGETVRPLA